MIRENTNIKIYFLYGLIAISFLARLIAIYFFKNTYVDIDFSSSSVNEWNILLQSLIEHKSYSFYSQAIPSVYMPPIYPFFLYLIKTVTSFDGSNLLHAIIFIQIILSTYSVYIFYQLNQNFFSNKISLINSIIFSFFPLNIYACGQISSINLQIIFSLLFLKFLLLLMNKEKLNYIIIFSIISGILILTRGEFILIFIIIILFGAINKKIKSKNLIKIILIVSLVVSPYVIRNYFHFNQILLVKSLGYNLWKGNNELALVQGYDNYENKRFQKLENQLNSLEKNKYYEINRDTIFLNIAKNNLIERPFQYLNLFFKKIFSFYFIDFKSTYPNYYNFFHIFPNVILAILSFPGLFIFFRRKNVKNNCLGVYLFSNLIIFSIFFILPRYKLIILPIQIIIATYFVVYLLKKITSNKKKINFN